jgi:hypothetical protein
MKRIPKNIEIGLPDPWVIARRGEVQFPGGFDLGKITGVSRIKAEYFVSVPVSLFQGENRVKLKKERYSRFRG